MSLTSILPNKPSELILLALQDLKSTEASEKYEIRMGNWHFPPSLISYFSSEVKIPSCQVCFAGSVMAFSLEADINRYYGPKDFPGEERKLRSLVVFRTGHVTYGMRTFYHDKDTTNYKEINDHLVIPHYHDDREGFYEAMAEMADYLKEKGY